MQATVMAAACVKEIEAAYTFKEPSKYLLFGYYKSGFR